MNKTLHPLNRGVTLVELLAVLAILSIISLTIYSVLFGGFKTYDRVIAENELRDEADYILTYLINDFFTLKSSEIAEKKLPETTTKNYFFVKTDGKKLGIINSEIIVNNNPISLTNDNVILSNESKIEETSPNTFKITLVLKHKKINKEVKLSSTLSIVNDRKED
ncbi:PilW family protein [Neobacillus muris]|uniref:PilW family protein n=1 Tax=Neobacillus muris TaxID=2941334 RepID=UPI0020415609|nr:prepilin-type N-terminal cleavage/methylation domain-containing protein [Neobacillus muris]